MFYFYLTIIVIAAVALIVYNIFKDSRPPKGESAAGLEGICVERIEGGGWGKVKISRKLSDDNDKKHEFTVNAVSAEGSDIEINETVIVLYESDGFYYVIKPDEVFKDIDTKF